MNLPKKIKVPYSKSISNRILILQALSGKNRNQTSLSSASDTQILIDILNSWSSFPNDTFNTGDAGTAFRFLTAFFALQPGKQILRGSDRMHQRPIQGLVDALISLGASITYLEQEGYPPIQINEGILNRTEVEVDASVSSQFITALLLIAPFLPLGLHLRLKNKQVSSSYTQLTIALLKQANASISVFDNQIEVLPNTSLSVQAFEVERDWSSIGYWYNWVLSTGRSFVIEGVFPYSIQGDLICAQLYTFFGVSSTFEKGNLYLNPIPEFKPKGIFRYNCVHTPDLFQTLVIAAVICKIPVELGGLNTLVLKETNRITAVLQELKKLDVDASFKNDCFKIDTYPYVYPSNIAIHTYGDHRMALAFSSLKPLIPDLKIKDEKVVQKSYPNYWETLSEQGLY